MLKSCLFFLLLFAATVHAADNGLEFRARVDHAFNRMAFGARPIERDEILRGGEGALKNWIKQQLEPDKIDDSAVDRLLAKHEVLSLSMEELQSRFKDGKDNKDMDPALKPDEVRRNWAAAKLVRAVFSKRQLQERLVDFWYNHFNVDQRKGKDRWYFGPYERDVIRPHVFGSFKDMLRASARHPAMLFYLDNHLSRVGDPKQPNKSGLNENYGRELLELHTLGVNGGYKQKDVTEAARILTGWTISDVNTMPTFEFREKWHDFGAKKVMDWDFPENHGVDEGERLLDLLARHPATAKHISRQLIETFIASPAPQPLVDKLAAVFIDNNGWLPAVYRELFNSQEFWDVKNRNTLVRDHFQWTIAAIRNLGGEVVWRNALIQELNNLGEPLYQCAPPTGYQMKDDNYVNSGSLVQRLNFSLRLAAERVDGVYISAVDRETQKANTMKDLISQVAQKAGLPTLSESTSTALASDLSGEVWQLNSGETRPFVLSRMLGLVLASPEFQRK